MILYDSRICMKKGKIFHNNNSKSKGFVNLMCAMNTHIHETTMKS